jgi:hypothetical protein
MGEVRNSYRIVVENPEEKRPLARSRCGWEDNIVMDLREIGFGVWIRFVWLRIGTDGRLL